MKQDNRRITTIFSGFLITVLTTGVVSNESFKECIPADTVDAFLSSRLGGSTDMSPDIPESFPEFVVPSHFHVLGTYSIDRFVRIALSSTLERQIADEALMTNLNKKGWYEIESYSSSGNVGFVQNDIKPVLYKTLCHKDLGQLAYSSVQKPSSSVFTIAKYPDNRFESSDCQADNSITPGNRPVFMGRFFPRLELPSNAIIYHHPASVLSSESPTDVRVIKTELSSGELFNHFSRQIEAQNWKRDASWKGGITTGATWTRKPDDDLEFVGTFSIVVLNESDYLVEFSLIPKGKLYR